jgi:16S rRNA (cytosine1402-N4)-methyltransferase
MIHKSVFKNEAIEALDIKPNGVYVDLTLGGGGHSLSILENLNEGLLISFDVDIRAIENFMNERLETGDPANGTSWKLDSENSSLKSLVSGKNKLYLANENFEKVDSVLKDIGINKIDGVLLDLGWSSDQLESVQGLSFENLEDELDMRFDKNLNIRASDLLNALGKKELKRMFERYADFYGEWNNKLVFEITQFRKNKLFKKVQDLNLVIEKALGTKAKLDKSLKARVFQALRISVNQEIVVLENVLPKIFRLLNTEGRAVIITFHSGEEKTLKKVLENKEFKNKVEIVSQSSEDKFLRPSVDELLENFRARSAKLWTIIKLS